MKKKVQSVAIILVFLMVSTSVSAQVAIPSAADKQKQEELAKLKEADAQAKKQDELAKLREYELQKKMQEAEQEMARHQRGPEYEQALHDYDAIRERAEEMSKDYQIDIDMPMKVMPDDKVFMYALPHLEDFYFYNDMGNSGKPGSLWNYTRQVLEATFTNEFTMDAGGDDGNVNLSVSGNCAEGSISVSIIMPDGKPLSEVLIDENGSLNWRKNLEENEASKWKNGKWIFKIKAKNATGNFRISMNSN